MKLKKKILKEMNEWELEGNTHFNEHKEDFALTIKYIVKDHYKQKKARKKQRKADETKRLTVLADKLSRLTMRVYELEGKAMKAKD